MQSERARELTSGSFTPQKGMCQSPQMSVRVRLSVCLCHSVHLSTLLNEYERKHAFQFKPQYTFESELSLDPNVDKNKE